MPRLYEHLKIEPGEMVGFVGAGGKTTTLRRLLAELRSAGRTVLTTSTVHMVELKPAAPHVFLVEPDLARLRAMLPGLLAAGGHVRVAGERLRADKIRGLDVETVSGLKGIQGLDNLLVECDGSRHRSLKAPAAHEPAVPEAVDLVLVVAGLDIIGKPLNEHTVHRMAEVQAITGLAEGAPITVDAVARLLTSPNGGLKAVPARARVWMVATRFARETEGTASELAAGTLERAGGRAAGVVLLGPAREGREGSGELLVVRP